MTLTIDISDEQTAELIARAQAHGLTGYEWTLQSVKQQTARIAIAHLQTTNPQD